MKRTASAYGKRIGVVVLGIGTGAGALSVSSSAQASFYNISTSVMTIADDGVCSLREAILAANTGQGQGPNNGFDCEPGTNDDVIWILVPSLTSTVKLVVERRLSINGFGVTSTTLASNRAAVVDDSFFEFGPNAQLSISGLTLRNDANVANQHITGIYAHDTDTTTLGLTLNNVRITKFTWGGIYLQDAAADIHFTKIDLNTSPQSGAGIGLEEFDTGAAAAIKMYYSEVSNNTGAGWGGGIYWAGNGGTDIVMTTIANNTAAFGGGVYVGTLETGYFHLFNDTIAFNTVTGGGGGGGVLLDTQVGSLQIVSSIIAQNNPASSPDSDITGLGNHIDTSTDNLYGELGPNAPARNSSQHDFVGNPSIGALRGMGSYGALYDFLSVCPLLKGSAAIDYSSSQNGVDSDQRGLFLTQDGDDNGSAVNDSGAFEKNLKWEADADQEANTSPNDFADVEADGVYSNGQGKMLTANTSGDYITFPVWLAENGNYAFTVQWKKASDGCTFQASTGTSPTTGLVNLGVSMNGYKSGTPALGSLNLGTKNGLTAGKYYVRLTTGAAGAGGGHQIHVDYIKVVKQ